MKAAFVVFFFAILVVVLIAISNCDNQEQRKASAGKEK